MSHEFVVGGIAVPTEPSSQEEREGSEEEHPDSLSTALADSMRGGRQRGSKQTKGGEAQEKNGYAGSSCSGRAPAP
ncbi:aspartyl-tRNA(Asn)/glutamyl-tRNA(Gln) amidotransferase subunit A [Sarotherodon galilaeus]